jgi:hypothetical protein
MASLDINRYSTVPGRSCLYLWVQADSKRCFLLLTLVAFAATAGMSKLPRRSRFSVPTELGYESFALQCIYAAYILYRGAVHEQSSSL